MKTSLQEMTSPALKLESENVAMLELDKANLVINQFIRSCSHSMRGPLKSIRGLVNILKNRHADNEVNPVLVMNLIDESTDKMETMLEELEQFMLNSSREINHKSIVVQDLIGEVMTTYDKEIKNKTIGLSMRVDQSSPFYSDPGRVRMILGHLVMNAITFQKADNPDKKITIRSTVDAKECKISVEDNGVGIEPDQCGPIFRLFYQATNNSMGAGIGLFVVREALEKMGGSIIVNSLPGKGSIFTLSFPNSF